MEEIPGFLSFSPDRPFLFSTYDDSRADKIRWRAKRDTQSKLKPKA